MARNIIILGIVLVIVGLLWPWLSKIPLGRLPGDIIIRREGFRLYLPITSCIVVSGILSLILWWLRK